MTGTQGIGSKNTIDHLKPCPRKLNEMKKSSLILLWPYNIGSLLRCDEANRSNIYLHTQIYVLLLKKQLKKHIQMTKTYTFLKMKKNVCKLKGHSQRLPIPLLNTSISIIISIIINVLTECLRALTTLNTFFFMLNVQNNSWEVVLLCPFYRWVTERSRQLKELPQGHAELKLSNATSAIPTSFPYLFWGSKGEGELEVEKVASQAS